MVFGNILIENNKKRFLFWFNKNKNKNKNILLKNIENRKSFKNISFSIYLFFKTQVYNIRYFF